MDQYVKMFNMPGSIFECIINALEDLIIIKNEINLLIN